jgi:hypothetical protein
MIRRSWPATALIHRIAPRLPLNTWECNGQRDTRVKGCYNTTCGHESTWRNVKGSSGMRMLCQRRVDQSLIVSDLAEPSAVSETIKVPRRLPTMR